MNVEIFSEWLRRQGHRVVETESSRWFDRGPRVFMAFPWHRLIRPSAREVRDLLRSENAAAARYSAPPDDERGAPDYDVVLESASYDMGHVSRSTRPEKQGLVINELHIDRGYVKAGLMLASDDALRAQMGQASPEIVERELDVGPYVARLVELYRGICR